MDVLKTHISQWQNNKKGTTFMWAKQSDMAINNKSSNLGDYPYGIDIDGKNDSYRWHRSVLRNFTFPNPQITDKQCVKYELMGAERERFQYKYGQYADIFLLIVLEDM